MTNKISEEDSLEQRTAYMAQWRELKGLKDEPTYNPNYNRPIKGKKPAWSKVDDILYSKSVNDANREVYS